MKHFLRLASLSVLFLPLLLLPTSAEAFEMIVPDESSTDPNAGNIMIEEGETIADDLFVVGAAVTIDGTVDGDLYVFAGDVIVNGTVTGDAVVMSGTLTVDGVVEDDLLVGTGDLRVNGQVGDNVLVGAGQSRFGEESSVGRDLVIGSGLLNFDGVLGRFLTFGAGDLTVNGQVGNSVRGSADTILLGSTAVVNGDVDFTGPQEPTYEEGSEVTGEKLYTEAGRDGYASKEGVEDTDDAIAAVLGGLGAWLVKFLGMVLAGAILLILAPMSSKAATDALQNETGKTLLVGGVALVTLPLVALLLIMTVVGARAALGWGAFLTFFVIMGHTFVGLWLGRLLLKNRKPKNGQPIHDLWVMSLGVLLVSIVVSIPLIGPVFSLVVAAFGVGAALVAIRRYNLQEAVDAPVPGASVEKHSSRDDSPSGDEE